MTTPVIGITTALWPREGKLGLVAAPESYVWAVTQAGGIPLLLPITADDAALDAYLRRVDGVLFTGGGDIAPDFTGNGNQGPLRDVHPERDRFELALMRKVVDRGVPFLAICRGIQVLNVAMGGTLYIHLPRDLPGINHDQDARFHEKVHRVFVEPESRLAQALGNSQVMVNSLHHQGLKTLGKRLRPIALAEDGLVEAVEVEGHPFGLGLQWHPELLAATDAGMARIFRMFVEHAARVGQTLS